jgi:hypothetical protein
VRAAGPARPLSPFLIDRLTTTTATLTLLPSRAGKRPRVFEIARVDLHGFALDRAASFEATLTNPVPRGDIATKGRFGPWDPDDPGRSAVEGEYRFDNADLGTIDGIAGRLQSTGRFSGLLEQILVSGRADVEGFGLTTSSNRLPLQTSFDACVDGTDGDTYLDRVEATLADTPIDANGRVEGQVGVDGRRVAVDARVVNGRIEDLLRLAVDDSTPLMVGAIDVQASLELPPGEADVVERLALDGRFTLREARFTEGGVQGKIDELSRRGRGDVESEARRTVRSTFGGTFTLGDGTLRLSRFQFLVPGATVQLQGSYGL